MIQDFALKVMKRVYKGEISHNTAASLIRNTKILLKFTSSQLDYKVPFTYVRLESLRPTKKVFSAYSESQIQAIFNAAVSGTAWMTLRNQAIFALVLDSGMRRSEVSSLKFAEFVRCSHSPIKTLHVVGKGAKERYVPIGKFTENLIKEYISACPFRDEYLFVSRFGKRLMPNSYDKITEGVAKKLDFPFTMHLMRHHFATSYLQASYESTTQMDAYGLRSILGHSSFHTTDMYIHSVTSLLAAKKYQGGMDRLNLNI